VNRVEVTVGVVDGLWVRLSFTRQRGPCSCGSLRRLERGWTWGKYNRRSNETEPSSLTTSGRNRVLHPTVRDHLRRIHFRAHIVCRCLRHPAQRVPQLRGRNPATGTIDISHERDLTGFPRSEMKTPSCWRPNLVHPLPPGAIPHLYEIATGGWYEFACNVPHFFDCSHCAF